MGREGSVRSGEEWGRKCEEWGRKCEEWGGVGKEV